MMVEIYGNVVSITHSMILFLFSSMRSVQGSTNKYESMKLIYAAFGVCTILVVV